MSTSTVRFLVITLTTILAFAAIAAASGPGYGVQINAESTDAEASGDACAAFNLTIENTGSAPLNHNIRLSVDEGDQGWTVGEAPPTTVTLAAGEESELISFTACAPAEAGDGETAVFTLTATVESDPAAEKASASEDFTASYSALAGTQDDGFFDDNETDDGNLSGDQGNDTGDTGDSPGPALVVVLGALVAAAAWRRRRT